MDDLDALWPAIARADAAAFARFLAHAELPLRRSLITFARAIDTESIVQEALLRVWQVAARYEPDGRPNGLLRLTLRIARNLALDEAKRVRRAVASFEIAQPLLEAEATPEGADPFFRDVVAGCLEDLPPQPSLALRTRLADEGAEPDASIAARCRMKTNTFLQNVSRARRLLAECLQKRAGWELLP